MQGTLPRLSATADLDSNLALYGQSAALHAVLAAQNLPQQPSSRLQVNGSLAGAPLSIVGSISAGPADSFTLVLERLDWKSAHGDASLRVDGDLLAPVGAVALRVGDLQDFAALLGEPLQGTADASVAFDHAGNRGRARVKLDGEDIALASTRLATLQLRGVVSDPFRAPRLALQLSSEALLQGNAIAVSAQANGAMDALGLKVDAQAEQASTVATANSSAPSLAGSRLRADAVWSESRQQLKLNQLEAQYRDQRLQLAAPALISFADGIVVEQLHLQWPPAQIQLQGRLTPRLDLRASVHNFNPGAVGVVMPLVQAQGQTDIELDLHGELSRPTGSITLSAGGITATMRRGARAPHGFPQGQRQLASGAAAADATPSAGSAHATARE